jgi:hypothetical protein
MNTSPESIQQLEGQSYDYGFRSGRIQGLKEMNAAWMSRHADEMESVERLRQEYQQNN